MYGPQNNHKHFYADYAPTGVANQRQVIAFPSKQQRDEFLASHTRDNEVRYAITRAQARRIIRSGNASIPCNCALIDDSYERISVHIAKQDGLIPDGACHHLVVVA